MANRAYGTILQYLSSARRFEEFVGTELGEVSQEALRQWVDHLCLQPISASRLRCHYSALRRSPEVAHFCSPELIQA
jgi:hypothetical protein